ncbi:cytochrome c3 family protein [Anaeromyxobacter paludicola]|uniref:Fibronectin type III domain protein n=1 Tax=Anaeromyxobacter paludicola TaxID=2918171 RepID=A0ABM7X7Q2_9BACT|nr:cytochrome c3 family protein [Anaeromyxobacter paludicola]BDG07875.1 hypothetical protein AMPC_09880 [Anaeromyxobacter paludicola]
MGRVKGIAVLLAVALSWPIAALANSIWVSDGTGSPPPAMPLTAPMCAGSATVDADYFSLLSDSASGISVSSLGFSFPASASSYIGQVSVADDSGTVLGTSTSITSISFSTPIQVTNVAQRYHLKITPKSSFPMYSTSPANYQVAGPGVGGTVSTLVSSASPTKSFSNATSATIYAQAMPAVPAWSSPGCYVPSQVSLSWSTGSDAASVVVLRRASYSIGDYPAAGTTYAAGQTIGSSTVVYAGTAKSFVDASVVAGQGYYYKIFTRDLCGNYSNSGAQAGPIAVDAKPADLAWGRTNVTSAQIGLTWSGTIVSSALVLRSSAPVADAPVDGQTYAAGATIGQSAVVYAGAGTSLADTTVGSGPYYYKLFNKGLCNGYSPGVSVGPLQTSPMTAMPASSGRLFVNSNNLVPTRAYDGAANAFGASVEPTGSTTDGAGYLLLRSSPVYSQYLLGREGGTSGLTFYQGLDTSWPSVVVAGTTATSAVRNYDVGFTASGTAMVVAPNGAGSVKYESWDPVAKSGYWATYTSGAFTGTPVMMKLVPRPGTNELALMVVDGNGKLVTRFWDGTQWDAEVVQSTSVYRAAALGDSDAFDGAWEGKTGNFIAFFAEGSGTSSTLYSQRHLRQAPGCTAYACETAAWGAKTLWGAFGSGPLQVVAAGNPLSNQIVAATNAGQAIHPIVWSGAAFGPSAAVSSANASPVAAGTKPLAVGWVSAAGSSAAMVMWDTAQTGGITYAWSLDGSFSAPQLGSFGGAVPGSKTWMQAESDPLAATNLMLTFQDSAGKVWAKRLAYKGGTSFAWSDADGGSSLNAAASTSTLGFGFSYDRAVPTAAWTVYVGDGTNPPGVTSGAPACLASASPAATPLDAFTLRSDMGDVLSTVTVTFVAGSAPYLALVEVTSDDGGTVYGSVATPGSDVVTVPLATAINVTATATQYRIRVTPRASLNLPTFAVSGVVTGIVSLSPYASIQDGASAALYLEQTTPDASWTKVTPTSSSVSLAWSRPADATSVLVLRSAAPVLDAPATGQTYAAPGALGASTIVYAGAGSTFTDASVSPGVAYYYKLFAGSACGGWSAGLQAGPYRAGQAVTAYAPSSGHLSYDVGGAAIQGKAYDGIANAFGGAAATRTLGTGLTKLVDRAAPTRNEHLVGAMLGSSLYVQRWNGTSWVDDWTYYLQTTRKYVTNVAYNACNYPYNSGTPLVTRRYDIAYLSSGSAVVVYAKGDGQGPVVGYRIWNGTSWTDERLLRLSRLVNDVALVKLTPRPGTDELALTVSDTTLTGYNNYPTGNLTTVFWNGSTWSGEPAAAHTGLQYGACQPGDSDDVSGAYESLTGNFILFWTEVDAGLTSISNKYRYYDRSAGWQSPVALASAGSQTVNGGAPGAHVVAAADPISNRVVAATDVYQGSYPSGSQINVVLWDGSAIAQTAGRAAQKWNNGNIDPAQKILGAGWLTRSGSSAAVVIWDGWDDSSVTYAYSVDGGAFSRSQYWSGGGTAPASKSWLEVAPDPGSPDTLMLAFSDANRNLWAKRLNWSGGTSFSWTDADGGASLNASPASDYRGFSFSYDRAPVRTNLGDGANPPDWPAGAPLCAAPLGGATSLDAFTLQNSAGSNGVTGVTVTFAPGAWRYLARVEVTDDAGNALGSVDYPTTDVLTVPLAQPLTVTGSAVQYRVRITPKTKAAMPAAPGAAFALTGTVTAVNGGYTNLSVSDRGGATVVIDDLTPAAPTWGTTVNGQVQGRVVRQDGQVTLNWTPGPSHTSVVIVRDTVPIVGAPVDGQLYPAGAFIDSSLVVYSGPGTTFTDTSLIDGTRYYYAVFGADSCFNYSVANPTGPVIPQPALLAVASASVSADVTSCSQATVTATFGGDTNDNSATLFQRGLSPTGPWTAIAGCPSPVGGLGARTCLDTTLSASQAYYYQATFTDPDGTVPPVVSSAVFAPVCASLALAPALPEPTGGTVAAGTAGVKVARFSLTASSGAVTLESLDLANLGYASLLDGLRFQLVEDATGNVVGNAAASGSGYHFSSLAYAVRAGSPVTLALLMSVPRGATPGDTFQASLQPSSLAPDAPASSGGTGVVGNVFTIVAGPSSGNPALGSPMVEILNPRSGTLSPARTGIRVQVRVYHPAGLAALAPSSPVTITSDAWAHATALTLSSKYPATPAGSPTAGVYETVLPLQSGAYTLVAKASNGTQTTLSTPVTLTILRQGAGDGMLLGRENSSQLCTDCHNVPTHSSETTQSQYGAWSTHCRDCHAPHGTTNVYLVAGQITPPPVNGYQPTRAVSFQATCGDSADPACGGKPSYVNADRTGPCQVCHTRTQDQSTGLPRWRADGNLDAHYSASPGPTQRCTDCHRHSTGFSADPAGGRDCVLCHNAVLSPMQTTTAHHHLMASSWSGTSAGSGVTSYPTSPPSGSQVDVNRRCLMCHVDHDLFLPSLNAAGGRGMNLRTDIALVPALPNVNFTNTDFIAATGGLCVSCHKGALTKSYVDSSGSTQTLVIDASAFSSAAHNYAAAEPFKDVGQNQFQANCAKCHVDRLGKRYSTDPEARFGLHGADWMDSSTLCYSCHRNAGEALDGWPAKAMSASDLYAATAMTPPSTSLFALGSAQYWPDDFPAGTLTTYYTPPTGYRTRHEIGANPAAHKPGVEGAAAADGSLSGANRHVECADCHDPHRAGRTGGGAATVTGFVAGTAQASGGVESAALDVLTDSSAAWPVNGRVGWTVKIVSGTGAGSTSTVFANTATTLTVKFGGSDPAPAAGSKYVVISNGAFGATDPGGALKGAWGVEPAFPAQPPPPDYWDGWGTDGQPIVNGDATFRGQDGAQSPASQPVYNPVTLTRTATPSTSAGVCLKCHSSYAYGTDPSAAPWSNNRRGSIAAFSGANSGPFSSMVFNDFSLASAGGCTSLLGNGAAMSPLVQASPAGCLRESDVANEFNPNNLAHHAVFAPGRNQPLVSSDVAGSVYNPNWPRFVSSTGVTVSVADNASGRGVVTLSGSIWPATTLPGWFLFVGSAAPAQGAAGWYQVAAIQDATHLVLDRSAAARAGSGQAFALTPGLGATFVPPWGPWSTLKCTDCHASDDVAAPAGATDAYGPHGSGQRWLLRNYKGKTYPVYSTSGAVTSTTAGQFQTVSNVAVDPPGSGSSPYRTNFCLNCHRFEVYGDTLYQSPAKYTWSRAMHPPATGLHYGGQINYVVAQTERGIACMICHGGGRVGSIHGSNLGHGHGTNFAGGSQRAGSYSGKRLMNGEGLVGFQRGGTSASYLCYTKQGSDGVSACGYNHQQYYSGGNVFYDYESGVDP